jgi:2-iminobutanoate/2-iminopropanoate deaminase
MKKSIHTQQAPRPVGCYSQVLLTGNFLFVSGQLAIMPATGKLVGPDIKEQTTQVLENTKAILTEAGMTMNDVVKSTLYLADINHFAAVSNCLLLLINLIKSQHGTRLYYWRRRNRQGTGRLSE